MIPNPPGFSGNQKANHHGKTFQTRLELTLMGYKNAGIADLEKVEQPIKVQGTRPNIRVVMLENPWLDYMGTWKGGRMIMLEAKSTDDERLPIDVKSGGVTLGQVKAIRRWHAAGAAVAVVWWSQPHKAMKIATAQDIILALSAGARAIQWRHLPPVSRGTGLIEFDILGELHARTSGQV